MALEPEDIDKLAKGLAGAIGGKAGLADMSPQERRRKVEGFALDDKGKKLRNLEQREITLLINKLKKLHGNEFHVLAGDLQNISTRFGELNDSVKVVRSSLRTFGKAAYGGTGSISEFTESLRGSSEFLNFIADFGKTLDVNAETYRGLAEVGANFNKSIVDMRNAAATAALPLDDFAKLVRDNSTTLAALYGTTNQGAMGIAGLAEALRTDATPELAGLGFTVDEVNETLLTNLDRQRRQGIFNQLTDGERTKSAKDFAMELDRLAKLTGQQRSELRKQLEQQASNARFAAFIRQQDDATGSRLSSFAATVSGVAPLVSEGLEDMIANAGRPVTDAGIQLAQNMPQLQGTIQKLIAGTISSEQALMEMSSLSTASLNKFSKAAVTGQVPFLELTPSLVALSTLTLDHGKVLNEQGKVIAGGSKALLEFQENAKRLSAATQSLETGFYSMLGQLGGDGELVGAIGDMSDNFIKGTSDFTKAMLYGSKTIAKMGLNLLRDTLPTYWAVYKGTKHGTSAANTMSRLTGAGKGLKAGLNSPLGLAGGGLMAATTAGMSVKGLLDNDTSNDISSWAGIAGSVIGGIAGFFMGGPGGAMLGASLGNMAGSALGGMVESRQIGTTGATGKWAEPSSILTTVDKGEKVLTPSDANTLAQFNLSGVESQLTKQAVAVIETNKKLDNVVVALNTGNMINNRSKIANERVASATAGANQLITG